MQVDKGVRVRRHGHTGATDAFDRLVSDSDDVLSQVDGEERRIHLDVVTALVKEDLLTEKERVVGAVL